MFDKMILIDKPAGMTSFGVVARVRRVLSKQAGRKIKVGHTGTLDPFATGLLILMAGKYTKKCQDFLKLDKRYEATIRLGATSTTGDIEGEIQDTPQENAAMNFSTIQTVVKSFQGEITQRVPAFSAVKINGERAYKLARKGEKVEMPERKVKIYEINIVDYKWPYLKIDAKVSSGTYIRALGEDIGEALGVGGYLTELRRTEIGEYKVSDAISLDDFMNETEKSPAA